jgi:hypothetical protein
MKIHWENIRWETDDVGTSWATLADEEHNSLTLENRDDTITFHTDGSPQFDISTILDLTALCMVLSRNALDRIGSPPQSPEPARTTPAPAAGILVPGQRHTPLTQDDEIEPKVRRLPGRLQRLGRGADTRRNLWRLPSPHRRPSLPIVRSAA